ncbi:lysophospholipase [Novosphingobium fuchskuhlense]|uniref:Lysophospholipase n=1 Tax=Novosphingobium fuchskuhlense TaxID=1117702 RepID=A0A117USR1_9SPHN|nr:alpha/beta hydrolase [Novosphingobium fuchskuhlense]KUR70186.1 lysophospholipase [Novosphingobium fuchskuhlense]
MSAGFDGPSQFRRAIPSGAREWRWALPDGHPIRRITLDPPAGTPLRGAILFLPGRADFYEKYLETLVEWASAGWQVSAADWRGQGASGRMTANPMVGHIEDFSIWIADLGALWQDWVRTAPGPHVLAGHSMGGHLALRAVAEGAASPEAVVLSAPMLGFVTAIPEFVQQIYGRIMCRIGDPERMAWEASEKPGSSTDDRIGLLTHDAERYADELWWRAARPELEIGPASWRWVERAAASMAALRAPGLLEAVMAPVLLLAAKQDALVAWSAIEQAADRLPRGELVTWGPEARHELLREADPVRSQVMAAITSFLDRALPAKRG